MKRALAAFLVAAFLSLSASAAERGKSSRFVYNNTYVDVIPNANQHLAAFNADGRIHGLSGRLITCRRLLKAQLGAHGENVVHAGVCTLVSGSETRPVEVCDSSMTNAFGVRALASAKETREGLAEFMQNCGG